MRPFWIRNLAGPQCCTAMDAVWASGEALRLCSFVLTVRLLKLFQLKIEIL
jgi:hypothetical protein